MSVHQCPRCVLRFTYRTELELHLREDHHPPVPAQPEPTHDEIRTDDTNHSNSAPTKG
jgi:hypothetical protein